ncbi:hypothetical protein CACET_c12480 [Clostridium aceticum]|uniref:Uncharacterized protein n=1 Tax=Clostridium aceticum TaxID=84022 RepID=A0A0G3W8N0_9CLOT|nr:hypothetical protein [Clostridium aceticum]AKL94713.1 hypothetical protein CACET_c12480 [Clostridium aceticum]
MSSGWELDDERQEEIGKCKCGEGKVVRITEYYSSTKPPLRTKENTYTKTYCKKCKE